MSSPLRVLFVEDDPIDQQALKRLVREQALPWNVTLADSVSEAQRALAADRFDVILTDYAVKDGTGLDAVALHILEIPTIFVTGSGREEVAVDAMKAGAFDYLIKDLDRNYLKLLPVLVSNAVSHHRTHLKLKETENHIVDLLDNSSDLVQSVTLDGRILYANRAWRETLGYSPAELETINLSDVIHPDSRDHCSTIFQRLLSGQAVGVIDATFVAKDGRKVELEGNVNIRNEHGRPFSTRGIFRDITERRRAEQALRASEERLRLVIEGSNDGIWDWDILTNVVVTSSRWKELFGYAEGQPAPEHVDFFFEMLHPDDHAHLKEGLRRHFELGEPYAVEIRLRHRDGHYHWRLTRGNVIRDASGRPIRMVGSLTDIHARKLAEAQIHQLNANLSQRAAQLEAINRELESFSYSVSHDLRAPLRAIAGWSQAIREDCAPRLDEQAIGHLDRVQAEAAHMGRLIDNLLKLSGLSRSPLALATVDTSACAQAIATRLRDSAPERQVEWRITPGLQARCDAGLLQILLTNLLENAWKFTSRRPDALIEFGLADSPEGPAFFVRDNGAGFDPKFAGKLFAPFQRMHKASDYPGSGIGLAIVQRIINRHAGRIWVEAGVDKGATFHFTFGLKQ